MNRPKTRAETALAIRGGLCAGVLLLLAAQPVAAEERPARGRVEQPWSIPPERPFSKDLVCATDADCAFLGSICPGCAPCTPTWRPVGTRKAADAIAAKAATVDCGPTACEACARESNWLGVAAICHDKQCRVLQAPAPEAKSAERACKTDKDCAVAPPPNCGCPPCGVRWNRAASRKHVEWLNKQYAIESCPPAECAQCKSSTRYVGDKAVCTKGQCTITLR